jgi:signal transduction histidine kinase
MPLHVSRRVRAAVYALEHLVLGIGTAVLALASVLWTLVALIPAPQLALPALRLAADRERARLSRMGPEVAGPDPLPQGRWAWVRDPTVRRELAWAGIHATAGFALGLLGLTVPLWALQDLTWPVYFWLFEPGEGGPGIAYWSMDGPLRVFYVFLLGLFWLLMVVLVGPLLAWAQAWPGRRLLTRTDKDPSVRIAHLTATRAAALDAHAMELRRIERSLHDGTQNRLVAVNMLLGAARRALTRDPAAAEAALDRAQEAAEQALAELRTVVRGILPPVLADRGLPGALAGLTTNSAVPTKLDVSPEVRAPASVEATAYYVVAEALTNVTKHSGASNASVAVWRDGDRLFLRIGDDGHGGADETRGSGLTGIRRRIEAHDGRLTLTSPSGGPTTMLVELPCGS